MDTREQAKRERRRERISLEIGEKVGDGSALLDVIARGFEERGRDRCFEPAAGHKLKIEGFDQPLTRRTNPVSILAHAFGVAALFLKSELEMAMGPV